MLASTLVITGIVAIGLVAWRTLGDDGGGSSGERGQWDELALVDRSTGSVTRVDGDGELIETTVGLGRVSDVHTIGDHLALVGPDQIVFAGPDAEPVTIPIDRGSTVTPIRTPGELHLAIGQPSGGNLLIADASTGAVLDVGALAEQPAPLLFAETVRWAADASAFAVGDARNGQTIVVQPGVEGAIFLPDLPIAVAPELVATSQVVGRQADVSLLDFERRPQAFVPTEIPAGGVLDNDRLVMVAEDGSVYRIETGDEESDRVGVVAVAGGDRVAQVHPIGDGDRLVVTGQLFEAVIDLDGRTVYTTSFTSPLDIDVPHPSWSCLPIGGPNDARSLIDVETGELLVALGGATVAGTSSDGCAVLAEREGVFELVEADGTASLGIARSAVLGPDGRSVVRTTADGRTELIRVNGDFELEDPVDLSAYATTATTVAFLDR